ncbi:MAG: hypothetical protein H0T54_09825 [Geodermatophilaceae bacterium]|nr:hypothetical protein [Geodermatophilaceae bacterium]
MTREQNRFTASESPVRLRVGVVTAAGVNPSVLLDGNTLTGVGSLTPVRVGDTVLVAVADGRAFVMGKVGGPPVRPVFHGYKTVVQSIAVSVWVEVTLDAEHIDTVNGHSTSTNSARYTPTVAGTYQVWGGLAFAPINSGVRLGQVRKNGLQIDSLPRANTISTSTFEGSVQFGGTVVMNGTTDYLSVWAYQNSTGALNTVYAAGNEGSFLIVRLIDEIA